MYFPYLYLSLWLERDHLQYLVTRGEPLFECDSLGVPHPAAVDVHPPAVLVPVWHDRVEELLEDVVALVEGEDVAEVGGVGAELPKVVLDHLHRRVYVKFAASQELDVKVGVIWRES